MTNIQLKGMDGTNPLGFLAALGVVATLNYAGRHCAKLSWKRDQTWIPVLHYDITEKELTTVLEFALKGKSVNPDDDQRCKEAQREFDKAKKKAIEKEREIKKRKLEREDFDKARSLELKPLEEERDNRRSKWLKALTVAVPSPELALGKRPDCTFDEFREHARSMLANTTYSDRLAIDMLSAFGSDACLTNDSKVIETTPFCFIKGSGNQWFLDTAKQLMTHVTQERIRRTLFEPWQYQDEKLSMRWDPSEDKQYALTDVKPADEGTRTEWMANLLAYRALTLFPCAPTRRGLGTLGWRTTAGREMLFTWPIWDFPASVGLIQLCVSLAQITPAADLRERGIVAVYYARRVKVGKGANFKLNFSPAKAIF